MQNIPPFTGGQPSVRDKLNAMREEINALSKIIGDGQYIAVQKGPAGVVIGPGPALLNRPRPSTAPAHPGKVATTPSGSPLSFTANLYDNGYGAAVTASAVTVTGPLNTAVTLTVSQEILVFEDALGNYWYEGAASGGGGNVMYARWANTSLAADTGVTPAANDVMLLIASTGGHAAGLYTYTGSGYTYLSSPSAVVVGNLGGVYGGLTFTLDGSVSSPYVAGGYAWA